MVLQAQGAATLEAEDVRLSLSRLSDSFSERVQWLPFELVESEIVNQVSAVRIRNSLPHTSHTSQLSIVSPVEVVPPSADPPSAHVFCRNFYDSQVFVCRYMFLEESLSLHETDVRTSFARGLSKSEFANLYSTSKGSQEPEVYTTATDAYAAAIRTLDLNTLPKQFPCRDEERRLITAYLRRGIEQGGGLKPMYVSGLPGTGKTASVVSCVESLKTDPSLTRKFNFLVINCLKLKSPNDAYSMLWKSISGVHLGQRPAEKKLMGHFDSLRQSRQLRDQRDTPVIVCLVDEIDFLLTSNQNTLYNMFDWPMISASNLVLISLANTMDLPERFHSRISSRLGTLSDRMIFKPYSVDQIEEILSKRMGELNVFEEKSLKLATRKAATVAGDLRAALRICQRAIEMHRNSLNESELQSSQILPISIQVVNRAANEYKQTPLMSLTRSSCPLYKAILVSIIIHNRAHGGSVNISSDELHRRLTDTIHNMRTHPNFSLKLPPYSVYLDSIDRMIDEGFLISAAPDKVGRKKRRASFFGIRSVRLRLEASDIKSALTGDCYEKLL